MIDYTIKPGTEVFCMVKYLPLNYIQFTHGELGYCIDKEGHGKEIYIKGNLAVTTITEDKVKVEVLKHVRWLGKKILVLTDEVGDIQWNYKNLEEYIVDTKNLKFNCNPIREGIKPIRLKLRRKN